MNKSKRPIANNLRKKMNKAIRNSRIGGASPEVRKYGDELTAKELLQQRPRKAAKREKELLTALQKKVGSKKAKAHKGISKRTTPGMVPSDSTPADAHREGKRWIKTLTQQISNQRAIAAHRGKKK
jgi:hypothetical protein